MSIVINRLVIEVNTADGPYGLDIRLSKGLFILRVDNTHGKSTCINSIAYALGMEMALGQQTSKPPFPPSLMKKIQDEAGREHLVISSKVMLEITNKIGTTVTLKRNVLGADAGTIITVYESRIDSISDGGVDLFLHREGDTTRYPGFYFWLSKFIGWDLPSVPSNSGKELPLYPALLFRFSSSNKKKDGGQYRLQHLSTFRYHKLRKERSSFW